MFRIGDLLSTRLFRIAGVGDLPAPGTVLALPQIWVYARWISCPGPASIEAGDPGWPGRRRS
jgi:hypothetical protein